MVTAGRAARAAGRLARRLGCDVAGLLAALRPGPLRSLWEGVRALRPGLYAYRVQPPGGTRWIHLRAEADGSGLLLVDATDAIHLNASAAWLAKRALDGLPAERAVAGLRRRFRGIDRRQVDGQVRAIYALVTHLTTTTDRCPTCGLHGVAQVPLFSTPSRAPLKADLALTYGCNNACRHCYNLAERSTMPAIDPRAWRRVLDRLAAVGVPQVIFTGGEPTLVALLPELVRYAGQRGLVTGLNTNGRRLAQPGYAESLARAGLSHVQITLESCRPEVHNRMVRADAFQETVAGIRHALAAGLHTITNTTLVRQNAGHAEPIVDFVRGLGLHTFAMNGMIYSGGGRSSADAIAAQHLAPVLAAVRDRAAELGMRFLWYTPTPYCQLSPLELELGPRRCNAAEYSICVEPNGDVLPCQSYYAAAGNILRDPWDAIWNAPLFRSFRDRVVDPQGCGLPAECWDCPDLSCCAGGCRLEREALQTNGGQVRRLNDLLPIPNP